MSSGPKKQDDDDLVVNPPRSPPKPSNANKDESPCFYHAATSLLADLWQTIRNSLSHCLWSGPGRAGPGSRIGLPPHLTRPGRHYMKINGPSPGITLGISELKTLIDKSRKLRLPGQWAFRLLRVILWEIEKLFFFLGRKLQF